MQILYLYGIKITKLENHDPPAPDDIFNTLYPCRTG